MENTDQSIEIKSEVKKRGRKIKYFNEEDRKKAQKQYTKNYYKNLAEKQAKKDKKILDDLLLEFEKNFNSFNSLLSSMDELRIKINTLISVK